MSYKRFAYVYDDLMKDAPYLEWVEFTENIIEQLNIKPKNILDLGCGTGSIAIPLSKKGYKVTGVDLSEEMLSIAYEKMQGEQLTFPLIQQNMKELELTEAFDLIISYCDSLNYLNGIEDVKETFTKVNKHLKNGAYFIFDMHSPYKLTHIYNDQVFAWDQDEIGLIWNTDVDETNLKVEHDLTFFVEREDGAYEKFKESHKQQTYSIELVKQLLEQTGFECIDTYSDFQLQPVHNETERIFYLARKL